MHMRLSADETARRLPYPELAASIATLLLKRRDVVAPERHVVQLEHGSLLLMPAASSELIITKLVTFHPENAHLGLPTIQGEVVVMRSEDGVRLGILDGATVTARRTAALSLLATKTLSPSPGGTLLVIGAGVQARAHLEAFRAGLGVEQVLVASRTETKAAELVAYARSLGLDANFVDDPAEVVADASLVVTATTSRTPVLNGPLKRSAVVCAVGSFQPEMAEVSADVVGGSRVVVDTLEAAKTEAGDLIQAAAAGRWRWTEAEQLEDLLAIPASTVDKPTLFKSVGHSLFDLAAAHVAFGVPI